MRRYVEAFLPAVLFAAAAGFAHGGASELQAFWREGQTFLTWKEDASVDGEWYRIYAGDRPLTATDLDRARCVAKVPEGSNHYAFLRNVKNAEKHRFFGPLTKEKWCRAIQIEDDENAAKQLPDGTGLFVRTIKDPAKTYYAVTVETEGRENRSAVAALKEPVVEKVETPGAVLLQKLGERYYIYGFFCDYERWNPDGIEDNWEGYAHVFHIRAPKKGRRGTAEPYPVGFRLHAYGAWRDWNIPYCWPGTHVNVKLLDYHLTWWYGYSDALPRTVPGKRYPPKGTVVNFTERRVLQVARWLRKGPKNFRFRVDPEQVCVYGGSMGGTGAHYLGTRHGDVFAAAMADEGIFNWQLRPPMNNWANNVVPKFGPADRNDMTNEGVPVYDLLNLPKQVAAHPERELPFMSIGQGIVDYVIPFHEVTVYWKALEAGKHPYAASWEIHGHSPWVGSGSPMDYRQVRRDEVIPAFANASCNDTLRSGFRIYASHTGLTETALRIKPGSLKGQNDNVDGSFPDLKGKTLVLGPSGATKRFFTIKSSTPTELTIEEGNLLEYLPPLTGWDLHVLKANIKKNEKTARDPTEAEKRAKAEAKKKRFLVCDGRPRGTWNGHFAWSTRNQNFDPKSKDDDLVDTAKKLVLCIRVTKHRRSDWDGDRATADVTPRRCRVFRPKPGETVRWQNWDLTDPAHPRKADEGEVKADRHGLVTVPDFVVRRQGWGSRLVLTRR
jgi:hypothetical protein